MSIVAISDIHMREQGDLGEQALHEFCQSEHVKNSKIIVFNGDIFDYAAGFHPKYWVRFERFFNFLKRALQQNKQIYFIEGNHDLHLEKVFRRYFQKFNLSQKLFTYVTREVVIDYQGKSFYFSHGDEIPGSKPEYIKYKNLIRSRGIQIIANLFPLWVFDFLAIRASGSSRHRSSQYQIEATKKFYAQGLKNLKTRYPYVDAFILGHSHIEEDENGLFNVGFAPKSRKCFVAINNSFELRIF